MTNKTQKQGRKRNESRYYHLTEQARKWPNLEEGIANDIAIGRFKEELICGAKDIATRVYEKKDSCEIETYFQELGELVDLKYSYIMSCNYDEKIGRLLGEVGTLIMDKLDFIRVQEMRKINRENLEEKIRRLK